MNDLNKPISPVFAVRLTITVMSCRENIFIISPSECEDLWIRSNDLKQIITLSFLNYGDVHKTFIVNKWSKSISSSLFPPCCTDRCVVAALIGLTGYRLMSVDIHICVQYVMLYLPSGCTVCVGLSVIL
ncbi:hypothetical protein XENORESO_011740 [Xenotaenia resolanae]|uniref:Uncharacterized protein n=1 Tax=Xenotaenia resolanae TaxID=208358 RepID=A0ABV0WRE1_9TELE